MTLNLILALLLAPAATAETPAPPPASMPAKTPLDADAPIEAIAADPAGKTVLEKEMPALLTHPAYEQIKTFSLRQVQPVSGGAITEEAVAKVDAALKALH